MIDQDSTAMNVEAEEMLVDDDRPSSPGLITTAPAFPASRIKRIVKMERPASMVPMPLSALPTGGSSSSTSTVAFTTVTAEAIATVTRATECFVEALARSAGAVASVANRRTVGLRDLAEAVRRDDRFLFAHDIVPLGMTLAEALDAQRQRGLNLQSSAEPASSNP